MEQEYRVLYQSYTEEDCKKEGYALVDKIKNLFEDRNH